MSASDLLGIFQTDLIIQSAIVEGFRDIKANPWLLDYIFSSLPRDELTAQRYGQSDVDQAKKWFLATQIPVFVNTRVDTYQGTCVTIGLQSSSEIENTLADVHYTPEEEIPAPPTPPLSPVFTPTYDPQTGNVTLPAGLTTDLFFEGMFLVNKSGIAYQLTDVLSDTVCRIQTQPVVDLTNVVLQPTPQNTFKVQLGSVAMRETFQIAVHESTDAYHCVILHSVLVFILLRYRKTLFEHRGLERGKFSSTDFMKAPQPDGEIVYERYLNFECVVRHYWPLERVPIAQGVVEQLRVIGLPNMPPDSPPATQLWIGELDVIK